MFIKNTIVTTSSVEWRREAFFKFVKIFTDTNQPEYEASPAAIPSSPSPMAATPTSSQQSDMAPSTPTTPSTPSVLANQAPQAQQHPPFKYNYRLKGDILKYIIIPSVQYTLENQKSQIIELIGSPPQPDLDTDDRNMINVFINKLLEEQNSNYNSTISQQPPDYIRIYLLQLSSVFVKHTHEFIHDVNNKKQGNKLRRLMTFAWPCLIVKTCVDPINKYTGLLLLSHIISKFAIHKRIVHQVFHALLKAHQPEAKQLVREALDILTPTFATRSEDGYVTLSSWIKNLLIEENHSIPQLAHICYIIVKYNSVFYFIRHSLINHLIISMQKISLSANSTPENRTLAIDLAEIILKWEAKRVLDYEKYKRGEFPDPAQLQKHPELFKPFEKHVSDLIINFFIRISLIDSSTSVNPASGSLQQQQQQSSDILSRRCLNLFKLAISTDLFSNADLKMDLIEKLLLTLESINQNNPLMSVLMPQQQPQQPLAGIQQPNYVGICICIEIVIYLIENTASKIKIQQILRSVQRGLTMALVCTNTRVVRSIGQLIEKLMSILPVDCFNNNPVMANSTDPASQTQANQQQQNDPIYLLFGQPEGILCRAIIESLSFYDKASTTTGSVNDQTLNAGGAASQQLNTAIEVLSNCLLLLKSASINNPQYIDRIMVPFMKILQKLYREHLNASSSHLIIGMQGQNSSSPLASQCFTSQEGSNLLQITSSQSFTINSFSELLIQSIDLIKFRVGVMSIEMRKAFINTILASLLEKSIDLRVIRYLIKLIFDWIKYNPANASSMSNNPGILINQIPTMKEKLTLLQRLTICVEKRAFFDHSQEIQKQFLEIIAYVYKTELYSSNIEFKLKLEQAFWLGLKSSLPEMREEFFELFNKTFASNDLYERLCYIIITQNWEQFGNHYWIKQCIHLTLGSCISNASASAVFNGNGSKQLLFPNLTSTPRFLSNQDVVANVTSNTSTDMETETQTMNSNIDDAVFLGILSKNLEFK